VLKGLLKPTFIYNERRYQPCSQTHATFLNRVILNLLFTCKSLVVNERFKMTL